MAILHFTRFVTWSPASNINIKFNLNINVFESLFQSLYQCNSVSFICLLFICHTITYKDNNTHPSQYACHSSALWYEVHVNRLRVIPRWHFYACCHWISLSCLFLVLLEHRPVVESHSSLFVLPDPCFPFVFHWSWLVMVSKASYLY